jgi:ribosomal protein L11 methyltransferase
MPGRWLVLTVRVPSEERSDELAGGLFTLGGAAVEVDHDRLTTYIAEPADPGAFLAGAADLLTQLAGGEPALTWRWQADEDWSRRWREGLAPRRVGRRLVVAQPWNVGEAGVGPRDVVLVIDPATGFGTGEHATTRGALRLMESVLERGERVLDVGTGSGILALAAAGLGASQVLAVESDPTAMGNARENLDRSPWADRIELANDEVDAGYLARNRGEGFDLVVANVLSGVLVPLFPALAASVVRGGFVIVGGIMESESESVRSAAAASGLSTEAEDREEGWWTALFRVGRS